jgi:endonuclease/exonuclease/phosphatase family metal-dependent hydrolase
MAFTALTYNLHKGRSFLSGKYILQELREELLKIAPDIVFLQEVMGLQKGQSHLEFFAQSLGLYPAYGLNNFKSHRHYGNAILTRFPLESFANRNISTNRFERRGSLQARVTRERPYGDLMLFCLHLDLLESGRALQIQNVVHQIKHQLDPRTPVLVAGDFNDWRGRVCSVLENELGLLNAFHSEAGKTVDGRTFPSFFPSVGLDRFYLRNLRVLKVEVLRGAPWNRFSDHCPVLATFEAK